MWYCDWTWRQGVCPAETIASEGYELVWLKAGGATVGDATNGWRERFLDPTFLDSATAVSLTSMVPGAYWYLVPGRTRSQAGLLYDLLLEASARMGRASDRVRGWAVKLDVEERGLTYRDAFQFVDTWRKISGDYPFFIYTNRNLWNLILPVGQRDLASDVSGYALSPYLEEAHWVAESARTDPAKPYASQQFNSVRPEFWSLAWSDVYGGRRYGYAGWTEATALQFTNNALIAGKRQMAGCFRGSKGEFITRYTDS